MVGGLLSGILWALDTVILGIALSMTPFITTEEAIIFAPFVSTFLHDAFSNICMLLYMSMKKELGNTLKALKSKSAKYFVIAALLGGPVGMLGYVSAIKYIGPSYTASISAMYPALGAFLSYVILKEKMSNIQVGGLIVSILGVIGLGYSSNSDNPTNLLLGVLCALLAVFGWASEGVVCGYGMKNFEISNEQALQIRQTVTSFVHAMIILPVISGWKFTISLFPSNALVVIFVAAFFGTLSSLLYYQAIHKIGAGKAMALNITYTVWSILFSFILLKTMPDIKNIICGVVIIAGSLVAANGGAIK